MRPMKKNTGPMYQNILQIEREINKITSCSKENIAPNCNGWNSQAAQAAQGSV